MPYAWRKEMMAVPLLLGLIEACEKEKERRKIMKVNGALMFVLGWLEGQEMPPKVAEARLEAMTQLQREAIPAVWKAEKADPPDAHAEWERRVANEAAILAGMLKVGMTMAVSNMEFAVSRLRKIDLVKILAVDLCEQIRPKQNPSTDNYSVREVPRAFGITEVEAAAQKCGISLLFNVTHNQVKAVIDFIESLGYRVPEKK